MIRSAARLAVLLAALTAPSAGAGEPVRLRLLQGPPGVDGRIAAALLIDLAPGWKTYWKDPGEAGLPPSLDLSESRGVAAAAFRFPAPHRFDDGSSVSNVYAGPTAVAIEVEPAGGGAPVALALQATIGVCRDVCVPVSAALAGEPVAADDPALRAAFAALPAEAQPGHGPVAAHLAPDRKTLRVEVIAPDGGANEGANEGADLFVAGPKGWFFGPPGAPAASGGRLVFEVPVTGHPRGAAVPAPRIEALVTMPGGRALEATIDADDAPTPRPGRTAP